MPIRVKLKITLTWFKLFWNWMVWITSIVGFSCRFLMLNFHWRLVFQATGTALLKFFCTPISNFNLCIPHLHYTWLLRHKSWKGCKLISKIKNQNCYKKKKKKIELICWMKLDRNRIPRFKCTSQQIRQNSQSSLSIWIALRFRVITI